MQPSPDTTDRATGVIRIDRRSDLVEASGDDLFVGSALSLAEQVEGWSIGTGVAWFTASRRRQGAGWLNVVASDNGDAAALVVAAIDSYGQKISGATLPAMSLELLPDSLRPVEYNLWDWFSTSTPPPPQPGEDTVTWAIADDLPDIVDLLDTDSPRHSARPGDSDVLRWCVIRDEDRLVACAALTEHVPGVAHLASIVTRTEERGRGLGRAITAWITRRLLEDGEPIVTLGMYADNEVARRLYRDLGYVDSHHFASGYLPGRRAHGDADPVHDEAD